MKIVNKAINDLKSAEYNPASRNKGQTLKRLEDSIKEFGLLCPILINKQHQIVDGHRRVTVMKSMDETIIPCVVLTNEHTREEYYATVNATQKRIQGNEALGIYLINPNALNANQRSRLKAMETAIGKETLKTMLKSGSGLSTYDTAVRLMRYMKNTKSTMLKKTIKWLMRFGISSKLKYCIDDYISPRNLETAVKQMKSIHVTYKVAS